MHYSYSCQYGTFIGNCEREREVLQLSEKTYSLWGYLIANNDEFTNPLYDPSSQSDVLRPTIAPQFIKFWSGLYCRFENGKKKFVAFTEKCDHEYLIITI